MLDFFKPNLLLERRESRLNGVIEVWRSWGLGKYLQVGGLTQSGWIIQKIWFQTLKKISHQSLDIKDCLILGLGGGSVVIPIQKYWPKAEIIGVDIDPVMVELGKKYLGLKDVDIKINDALEFMSKGQEVKDKGYDLIIVDLYQGNKIPARFETDKFIWMTRLNLVRGGIVIFNRLYPKETKKEVLEFGKKLKKYFSEVRTFKPAANLMFICKKA